MGFTGPIELPAIDVMGLKSAPRGVEILDVAEETAVALGNNGLFGMDAPLTGGMPGGIPCIILQTIIIYQMNAKL